MECGLWRLDRFCMNENTPDPQHITDYLIQEICDIRLFMMFKNPYYLDITTQKKCSIWHTSSTLNMHHMLVKFMFPASFGLNWMKSLMHNAVWKQSQLKVMLFELLCPRLSVTIIKSSSWCYWWRVRCLVGCSFWEQFSFDGSNNSISGRALLVDSSLSSVC